MSLFLPPQTVVNVEVLRMPKVVGPHSCKIKSQRLVEKYLQFVLLPLHMLDRSVLNPNHLVHHYHISEGSIHIECWKCTG